MEINRKHGSMIPYIFACNKLWVLVFLSSGTCRYYLQFVMIWLIRANLLKLMKTYRMYLVVQNLINKSSFRWILSCVREVHSSWIGNLSLSTYTSSQLFGESVVLYMHVAQEKGQLLFERYMKSKLKVVIGKQKKKL